MGKSPENVGIQNNLGDIIYPDENDTVKKGTMIKS